MISVNFVVGDKVVITVSFFHPHFDAFTFLFLEWAHITVLAELSKIFLIKNTSLYNDAHCKKHFIGTVFLLPKKSSSIALCNLMAAGHTPISVIPAEIWSSATETCKSSFIS